MRLPTDAYLLQRRPQSREAVNLIEFMFNNYRHRAPPSPCPGSSRGGAGAGAYAPSSEDGSPKSDFSENKKGPQGQAVVPPPRHTKFQDFIYNISLCPRGRKGHLAASWRGPKPSCLFSHFISSDNRTTGTHCRHRRRRRRRR